MATTDIITIQEMSRETHTFAIVGTEPLIFNRMSQKVKQELLLPKGRKTAADKASTLKHDPLSEFRATPYILADGPTAFGFPVVAFKAAMATAALEVPGIKKTQIHRLVYMPGTYAAIYGIPKIFCAITRSADMNRTPDVRTRAILPKWCALIRVQFATPQLNQQSIANLLSAGGMICGVGDWRQEKGSGNFGSFEIVGGDDDRLIEIMKTGGRDAQLAALESPEAFDAETEELLSWFNVELKRRGMKLAA